MSQEKQLGILKRCLITFQVKFGNTTFKTDVCPKSLNPQWNSEWFKFEVKCLSLNMRDRCYYYIKLQSDSVDF